MRTWGSPLERALYQSEKLHTAAAESNGVLRIVRMRAELEAFLKAEPVSHTGVQYTCPGPRNLSDAQICRMGGNAQRLLLEAL